MGNVMKNTFKLAILIALPLAVVLAPRLAWAQGQNEPETLIWERVGTLNDVLGLFFDSDTLFAAPGSDPFQVLRPGDEDWSRAYTSTWTGHDITILENGTIFFRWAASSLRRSDDGGAQFFEVHDDALSLPVVTPEGFVALGTRGRFQNGGTVADRSTDDGNTWTDHGFAVGSGAEGEVHGSTAILVMPPSSSLPQGRLIATGFGGIAYSDDDGRSWYPTSLFGAFVAWGSARLTGGTYDGQLLAVVEGLGGAFYSSVDGIEWNEVAQVPTASRHHTRLAAVPGGGVYAYDIGGVGAPVWYSADGGVTWEDVGPVWTAWPATTEEIVIGPDGRLYAACSGPFGGIDGGVFRTVDPVIVVANESPPEKPEEEPELRIYPNPTTARLTIAASGIDGDVVLYDLLGRVVLRGRLVGGRATLDTSRLPAGVYMVQIGTETQRVTLIR